MMAFIIKRVCAVIPLLFFITFLTLLLINVAPGDVLSMLKMNPTTSPEVIALYEDELHINESVFVQYWHWFSGLVRGDLGYSFSYKQSVAGVIGSRLLNTCILTMTTFLLSWSVAIPLGMYAGWRRGRVCDRICTSVSYACISVPSFFIAVIILCVLAQYTSWPLGGIHSPMVERFSAFERIIDFLQRLYVPVLVLSVYSISYVFRVVRTYTIEELHTEHVLVLRARQLPESVVAKHVMRNVLNPLISLFGLELPALFSGAGIVEIITGWPGLGSVMLDAVRSQDMYLIMGNMVMVSLLLVFGTLVSDVLLARADPRVVY